MSKNKIPTFVLELPLVVNEAQEKVVLARLEAARQVYNACLGEALRRRDHLLHSPAYKRRGAYQAAQPAPKCSRKRERQSGLGSMICTSMGHSSDIAGWGSISTV